MKKIVLSLIVVFLFVAFTNNSRAQDMKVGAQIGVALPLGDFGDVASTGFGGLGTFHYVLKPNITLTGALGYYYFGSDKDISNALGSYGDYSYSIIPLVAGIRYHLGKKADEFNPYIGGEIGLYFVSFSYKANLPYWGTQEYSDSETKFGLSPMAGFTYNLQKNLVLDVNAKFSVVEDLNHFVVNVGLIFNL